jgi:Carbohydrate binding domain
MEDDTMDRAEPQRAVNGAPAPQPSHPGEPPADGQVGDAEARRALPAPGPPEHPERPRGRHEALAPRRSLVGPAGAAIAVVIASVVFAGILATWLISSAEEAPTPAAGAGEAAASSAQGGPTSRPPGQGSFGNLVVNWSFEQDLSGWEPIGEADASQEPQGRTSGSCAAVRSRGSAPARVGLGLPEAVPSVKPGQRYVASAWVRSTAPGQRVTLRLVGGGGREVSKATATTLPGVVWKRVIVAHTARAGGPLKLEIVADGVPPGEALLVDEVVVRLG